MPERDANQLAARAEAAEAEVERLRHFSDPVRRGEVVRRISDDLAMWRAILFDYQDVISGPDVQRGMDAAAGVEAELARRDDQVYAALANASDYERRAVAAEAEVERLTEALRGIAGQEPDEDDVQDADPEFVLTHPRVFSGAQVARAVLAGRKDTPQ